MFLSYPEDGLYRSQTYCVSVFIQSDSIFPLKQTDLQCYSLDEVARMVWL